uniref:Protein kinase domain-containing protein n=1 Tax=Odontella aurita TaxID=265563 RepID=A0A7S4JDB6_9STRA|mmetsp:Transcript_44150/g.134446  ORF Transcript_44150/g.134446 Transcript_44150/m.134446 type:complete len:499 (+) Transcript_44150:255-1751(+)
MASMAAPREYPLWPAGSGYGVPPAYTHQDMNAPYRMNGAGGIVSRSYPYSQAQAHGGQYQQQQRQQQEDGNAGDGVDPIIAAGAGRAAHRALQRMTRDSRLFHDGRGGGVSGDASSATSGIALIDRSDLIVGRLLGRGGFSEVHEARLASSYAESATAAADADAGGNSPGPATKESQQRYAVKFLRARIMKDKKKFERGAADLAIEAKLLSAFDHRHIIRLHGVTSGSLADNIALGRECSFFLILDRLHGTLDDRIQSWKERQGRHSSLLYRATHGDLRGSKRRSLLLERLRVMLDLARAVGYLHDRDVAYRDIKPENVGFDSRGVLKLFDFGLAKELKTSRRYADGSYRLTGNTGSRRYMAPEVARARPYNLSVDSYSFGILLWEVLALEKPFMGFSEAKHTQMVVEGGARPSIDRNGAHSHWPVGVQNMMELCWAGEWRDRPTFVRIVNVLGSSVDMDNGSGHGRRSGARSQKNGGPRLGCPPGMGSLLCLAGEAA